MFVSFIGKQQKKRRMVVESEDEPVITGEFDTVEATDNSDNIIQLIKTHQEGGFGP